MKFYIIGQGPNQTCWKAALKRAEQRGLAGSSATAFAEAYCARLAATGRVGEHLARLLGMEPLRLYRKSARLNLNARWNGKNGKGDLFDEAEGKENASKFLLEEADCRALLLGKAVARCFGIPSDFLVALQFTGKQFMVFPHPSGVNAWWNTAENRRRAAVALKEFAAFPES